MTEYDPIGLATFVDAAGVPIDPTADPRDPDTACPGCATGVIQADGPPRWDDGIPPLVCDRACGWKE